MLLTILNEFAYTLTVRLIKMFKALIKFLGALLTLVLTPLAYLLMVIEIPIGMYKLRKK